MLRHLLPIYFLKFLSVDSSGLPLDVLWEYKGEERAGEYPVVSKPSQEFLVKPGQTLVISQLERDASNPLPIPYVSLPHDYRHGYDYYLDHNAPDCVAALKFNSNIDSETVFVNIKTNFKFPYYERRHYTIPVNGVRNLNSKKINPKSVIPEDEYQLGIYECASFDQMNSTILDDSKTVKVTIVNDGFDLFKIRHKDHFYGKTPKIYIGAATFDVHLLTTENGVTTAEQLDTSLLNAYNTECMSKYERQEDGTCQLYPCICEGGISVGDGKCDQKNPEKDPCSSCNEGYDFVPVNKKFTDRGKCVAIPTCSEGQTLVKPDPRRRKYTHRCV